MRGHRFLIALLLCLLVAPTCRSVAQSHALPPPVGGITFTDVNTPLAGGSERKHDHCPDQNAPRAVQPLT